MPVRVRNRRRYHVISATQHKRDGCLRCGQQRRIKVRMLRSGPTEEITNGIPAEVSIVCRLQVADGSHGDRAQQIVWWSDRRRPECEMTTGGVAQENNMTVEVAM